MHSPRSSPLYFFFDASENNSEDNIPSHEFQEENDWAYGNPGNLNRQNYVRNIHISDRQRKQLSASSSFNKHVDDEGNSYTNLNYPLFEERPSDDEKADFLFGRDPTFDTEAADLGDAGVGSTALNVVRETVQSGHMVPTRESSTQDDKSLESSGRDAGHDMNTVENMRYKTSVRNIEKKNAVRSVIESSEITPGIGQSIATTNIMNEPQTRISTEQLKEIKSAISIIDAIESYNLPKFIRTNSHTAKACCPFHNDNNPSMSIDENRGIYKCFACGAGGDIFNFVREYDALNGRKEKMGFWEAVQFAATEFGGGHLTTIRKRDPNSRKLSDNISDEAKRKILDIEKKKER
jgi:DNA primase